MRGAGFNLRPASGQKANHENQAAKRAHNEPTVLLRDDAPSLDEAQERPHASEQHAEPFTSRTLFFSQTQMSFPAAAKRGRNWSSANANGGSSANAKRRAAAPPLHEDGADEPARKFSRRLDQSLRVFRRRLPTGSETPPGVRSGLQPRGPQAAASTFKWSSRGLWAPAWRSPYSMRRLVFNSTAAFAFPALPTNAQRTPHIGSVPLFTNTIA
jgi:hypothetical protein